MSKIYAMYLGHADYLDDNAHAIRRTLAGVLARELSAEDPAGDVSGGSAAGSAGNSEAGLPLFACSSAQAVACARAVRASGASGAILVLATWVECDVVMSALKELQGVPMLVYAFPLMDVEGRRESTGAYVSGSMISGVIRRLKLPVDVVLGSWEDQKVLDKLKAFAAGAVAAGKLKYSRVGLFGYTSMSIYTGTFDHVLMRYMIGPEIAHMDSYSLIRLAQEASPEKLQAAEKKLRATTNIRADVLPDVLKRTLGIYTALKELCETQAFDAVNVKCQYEFSKEYKTVPCVALSLLADDGIVTSCEGDIPCTVSMLLLNALSGQTATYGDSLNRWDNIVEFSPCGFMPFSLGAPGTRVQKFLEHPGFTGIQVSGVMRPEKVTFLRLVEDIGSYHILYGTGQGLPTKERGGCMPALDVELDGSADKLEQEYAGQHYALVYGDWAQEVEAFAKVMQLPVVRV